MTPKTDRSIKNICVAAVRRHAMRPFDFRLSTLFENDDESVGEVNLHPDELLIARLFIDESNWTVVTTRRVVSCIKGDVREALPEFVENHLWGFFKDRKPYVLGELTFFDGGKFPFYVETGEASMIIIYSIMTLVKLSSSANT